MSFKPGDFIKVRWCSTRRAVVLAYHEMNDIYPLDTVVYMYSWGWIGSSFVGNITKTGEFIEPMRFVEANNSLDIYVGDEIRWTWADIERTGCITRITNNGLVEIIDTQRGINNVLMKEEPAFQHCVKTGRHTDVARVMKELEALEEVKNEKDNSGIGTGKKA